METSHTTQYRASHHPIDEHVGRRVRLRRKALGISQSQLSEQLHLSFQQIQKYELAGNRISASKLYEIAHALGVSPNYFFVGLDADGVPTDEQTLFVSEPLTRVQSAQTIAFLDLWQSVGPDARTVLMNLMITLAAKEERH